LEDAIKVWKKEGFEEGLEEGVEKGIEKGRAEGKFEVARSMLAEGLSTQTVRKYTGLDESVIMSLR
jgi:predicted transposase/invertase (TIGR01784 family)